MAHDCHFLAIRSSFRCEPTAEWSKIFSKTHRGIVLVNSDTELPRLDEALAICDGDVQLTRGDQRSVVIANGTIRGGAERSFLAATGDIVFPGRWPEGHTSSSVFHAGGAVTFAGKPAASDRVRERQG
ncbi:MAG: hypothetical protein K2V38_12455, partial [Gemmataceae bacterium]|nr:hypothetical protein [Gemmataceae bacterium]